MHWKILKQFPNGLHMLVAILLLYQAYWDLQLSTISLVECIYNAVIITTHIAIFIDDVFSVTKIRKMLAILFDSFEILKGTLKIPMCLRTFEQNFRLKLFLCVIINVFLFLLKLKTKGEVSKLKHFWSVILTVYKMIALFQVVFFVDFSNRLLFSLNKELSQYHGCCEVISTGSRIEHFVFVLHNIQKIHFKLCNLVQITSSRFGWFICTLLMELIVIPCICIFFIFVFFTGPVEWRQSAYRKYLSILFN